MVRKEERRRGRGPTGWDGAAGEIHRRNFSDLLSSHLLHWREERGKEGELHYFFVVPSYVKFVGSFIHTGSSEWPLYSLTHDFFALVFVPTLVTTEGEMRDFQNSSSARRPLS